MRVLAARAPRRARRHRAGDGVPALARLRRGAGPRARARGRGRVPRRPRSGRAHRVRGRPRLRPVPRDAARALRARRTRSPRTRSACCRPACCDRRRWIPPLLGGLGGLVGGLVLHRRSAASSGVPGMWTATCAASSVVLAAIYDAAASRRSCSCWSAPCRVGTRAGAWSARLTIRVRRAEPVRHVPASVVARPGTSRCALLHHP